jgi:hypothetical protein
MMSALPTRELSGGRIDDRSQPTQLGKVPASDAAAIEQRQLSSMRPVSIQSSHLSSMFGNQIQICDNLTSSSILMVSWLIAGEVAEKERVDDLRLSLLLKVPAKEQRDIL